MAALVCIGFGYSARVFARRQAEAGWSIIGTVRRPDRDSERDATAVDVIPFTGSAPSPQLRDALKNATHVVVSVPPDQIGDPVIRLHGDDLRAAARLRWIGYLSTIGVYGDHDGGWVDEDTPANPASDRSQRRLEAEDAWLRLGRDGAGPVQVFRLSGIYGPGRSAIDNLREGTARRIIKPRQVFNRIHVEDIAAVLSAAASGRGAHTVYNVTDDEPAPPQDVIAFAADLLGLPVPEDVPFEAANLSPMAATFYAENKRVRNGRIKSELDVQLKYPSYREGLRAIADMARPSFMDSS